MTHIHQGNLQEVRPFEPRIFLDGHEMHYVAEANDEAGYIVMYVLGRDGDAFVDPRTNDVRTVRLEGVVDITFGGRDLSEEYHARGELRRRRQETA